jgi:RimJ/RimL family protein N-acetyltransferase
VADAPRVVLEPLVPAHAELLYVPLQDDRLYRFIDEERPSSVDALRQRYAFPAAGALPDRDETWRNWLVRHRTTARPLGTVQATIRPVGAASIAYVFLPPAWGHGYATEAVGLMLAELRSTHDVGVAQAEIDPGNDRSIRLVQRLGFERTDIIDEGGVVELIFRRRLPADRTARS